ncbi:Exocyst complex component exo84a [Thalictrum thalictroides]|uniref:Exocyst complex component exo84a n=1 Tax=Thalictrum thalictroides TaxID=46969 RepID=A0A7J6UZJ5_THATH|nr:Exocyst complex component exo84a [Thalictrum thalictroides]
MTKQIKSLEDTWLQQYSCTCLMLRRVGKQSSQWDVSLVLLKLFRPCFEQALDANLKRIEESSTSLAAADDWVLTYLPVSTRPSGRPTPTSHGGVIVSQPKISSSAHRFDTMVRVINRYVLQLINALPGSMEAKGNSGNKIAWIETEAQHITLLGNASLLADELLPQSAMKLGSSCQVGKKDDSSRSASDKQNRLPEQREWKRRLQLAIDRMDGNVEEPELLPSPIFNFRMSSITADMFVGRERVATILLMRLTETVITCHSNYQTLWEEIEEGPTPLVPLAFNRCSIAFHLILKVFFGCNVGICPVSIRSTLASAEKCTKEKNVAEKVWVEKKPEAKKKLPKEGGSSNA